MAFDDLFNKLQAEEEAFMGSEFFSPVLRDRPIRVRIAGIVMEMKVQRPRNFVGWGVFKATSLKTAELVREPTMQEKQEYYKLFPVVRFILSARHGREWFGVPANASDGRFKIQGNVPIRLTNEVQMFDMVCARFDGANFWFEQIDPRHSPRNAVALREALANLVDGDKVQASGLTKEEKAAYEIALYHALENLKDRDEERIKLALQRAGAEYRSYVERGNTFTVEYIVDGQNQRSVVDKETLSVQTAGICLTDHDTGRAYDQDFDLQSLVGVIREGMGRRAIYRV